MTNHHLHPHVVAVYMKQFYVLMYNCSILKYEPDHEKKKVLIPCVQQEDPDKTSTVKPVLSGHSKIDKTNVLKTNGSLMKVESIAECSLGAFCNTFDLH